MKAILHSVENVFASICLQCLVKSIQFIMSHLTAHIYLIAARKIFQRAIRQT